MRVLSLDYPSEANMRRIFASRAAEVLPKTGSQNAAWHSRDGGARLADALLATHSAFQARGRIESCRFGEPGGTVQCCACA